MRLHKSPLPRSWPADPAYRGDQRGGAGSVDVAERVDGQHDIGDRSQWDAVAAALRSMAFFDGLPPAELAEVAQAFRLSSVRPRQLLEVQDAPVRRWQMIASGHVVVRRDEVPLGLLGAGESWSEHSLLNRYRSPISVVALSPATVLSVDEQRFWGLVADHQAFRERIVARSAASADRLALPFLRALMHMEKAAG
jgi:CRP-like cAMP-binding protein